MAAIQSAAFSNAINIAAAPFNAKGDGVQFSNFTTTSGSNAISCPSYRFRQKDVGKLITIAGAGAAGAVLNTTITGHDSERGTAFLAINAGTSIAGTGVGCFGSDDTNAIQSAVNAAGSVITLGGGTLYAPSGVYIVSSSVTWLSGVSLRGEGGGKTIFRYISSSDQTAAVFHNVAGNGMFDCQFRNFEIDCSASTATGGYQVLASGIRINATIRAVVENVYVHDTPASALAFDFAVECLITKNVIINPGALNGGSNPGGAGIGNGINASNTQSYVVTDNLIIMNTGGTYGILFEEQSAGLTVESSAIVSGNIIITNNSTMIAAIGDCGQRRFQCINNHVTGSSTGAGHGIAIQAGTTGNDPGNQGLIVNNVISAITGSGIVLDYTTGIPAGQKCGYIIRGNRIQAANGHGVKITCNASTVLDTLIVEHNWLQANAFAGFTITGAGGAQDVILEGNVIANNGTGGSGITAVGVAFLCAVTRPRMIGNSVFDNNTGTQKYAVGINTSINLTGAYFVDNDFSNNATGAINFFTGVSQLAGWVVNNKGYNPVGAATQAAGGSPWTYTAGATPETLFLYSGTVSSVTVGGITVATASPTQVQLSPGESAIVTYSVAPTAAKHQH